jgi:hypothetical protein
VSWYIARHLSCSFSATCVHSVQLIAVSVLDSAERSDDVDLEKVPMPIVLDQASCTFDDVATESVSTAAWPTT